MPLTENQQQQIKFIFEDLFDLTSLKPAVETIQTAFKVKKLDAPPEEKEFTLEGCIQNPMRYFIGIESQNKKITTVGDVLTYLLDIADEKITTARALSPEIINWDKNELLQAIQTRPDYNQLFESQRPAVNASSIPLLRRDSPARLFQVALFDDAEDNTFNAIIDIDIPFRPLETTILEVRSAEEIMDENYEDEEEREQGLEECRFDAEFYATEKTSRLVLDYFVETNIISANDAKQISKEARVIITYLFYFDLLKSRLCQFSDIASLNSEETESLLSVVVMDFIKTGKCTIDNAKLIDVDLLENPFYFQKIINNEISMDEFIKISSNLSKQEFKNLASPSIIRLISKGKLSIYDAKKMSMGCRKLLENEHYAQLLIEGKINLQLIIGVKKSLAEALLHPKIMKDLKSGIISFKELFLIENPLFLHLIAKDVLAFEDLKKLITIDDSFVLAESELTKNFDEKFFKLIMYEFLKLAEDGLFIAEDMNILYMNINKIRLKNPSDSKNEKSEAYTAALLLNPCLKRAAHAVINMRLDAIHQRKPLCLPGNKIDSLENVIAALKKYQIKSPEIWSYIFTLRLMGILQDDAYCLNERADDFAVVKSEMDEIATWMNLSFFSQNDKNKFVCLTIKKLLFELIDDIKDIEGFEPIQQIIAAEFKDALKQEKESRFIFADLDLSCWKKAFENVTAFARDKLSTDSKSSSERPSKRQKISTSDEMDDVDPARVFYQRLLTLSDYLLSVGISSTNSCSNSSNDPPRPSLKRKIIS